MEKLEKKVTCKEVDDANDTIVRQIVKDMTESGKATRKEIENFMVAQSHIQIETLKIMFGDAEVKAMLREKAEAVRGKVGEVRFAKMEKQTKDMFKKGNR